MSIQLLKELTAQMTFEPAEERDCPTFSPRQEEAVFTHDALLPNGKKIRLLKTLLTSACERNCFYCPFRAGRDFRRATFKPHEFAALFGQLQRAGAADGLFLSSGIVNGGIRTQDQLLDTADMLRRQGFRGYIHLKLMPGAERDQILQAMRLADRVSINLEAPNAPRLEKLAPLKSFFDELMQPLRIAEQIRRTLPPEQGWNGKWASLVTQFVAGGAGESDRELLATTDYLHRNLRLERAYFSAFHPVPNTPLENQAPTAPQRELRLYQASFLLRDYGFSLNDLPLDGADGNLPLDTDPKLAWAQSHLAHTPLDVQRAECHDLLRIPGIGPKSAARILALRRTHPLRELSVLQSLGVNTRRAAPFILLDGKSPPRQMPLWE
ncbi:MAG: putative DNA modification/repair radical SAM protein [Anaerolineales bacterium]